MALLFRYRYIYARFEVADSSASANAFVAVLERAPFAVDVNFRA